MLFVAWDYFKYRKRRDKYSDDQRDGGMALAFVDTIPDAQISQFRESDLVFTQRLNSFLSWAMMYITSAPIDHAAVYVGDGKVFHMTLAGSGLHSIRALAKGSRTLVVRMTNEQQLKFVENNDLLQSQIDRGSTLVHQLPPKVQLFVAGLKVIHGKYPDRFRIVLWSEFFISVVLVCLLVWIATNSLIQFSIPVASFLTFASFTGINILRHCRGKRPHILSHPDIGYRSFFKSRGLMFTRIGPIGVLEIGALPLNVIFRFACQRTYDGPDDDLDEAGKFFAYLIEGWYVRELCEKAKSDDSN